MPVSYLIPVPESQVLVIAVPGKVIKGGPVAVLTDTILVVLDVATSKLGEGGVVCLCSCVLKVALDNLCFRSEVHRCSSCRVRLCGVLVLMGMKDGVVGSNGDRGDEGK